jgi:uncharacterized protein YbdZ (MbtH family)
LIVDARLRLSGAAMPSQPAEVRYLVVINHEDQYSIWPEGRDIPPGWSATGVAGTKAECLADIDEVWTDMRPRSLREQMERATLQPAATPAPIFEGPTLVERLSVGEHAVEVVGLGEDPLRHLRERVKLGHVMVRFPETRGGTELGIRFDPKAFEPAGCDLDAGTGQLSLQGDLTLDGTRVRLHADIDVTRMAGRGRLEILS